MGKVNKAGAVRKADTSERKPTKRAPSGARGVSQKSPKAAAKRRGRSGKLQSDDRPSYQVRELDPLSRCGNGTSVQKLFRIDEKVDGVVRPHLVFFDRHGWYCEHGRDCPAVSQARKRTDIR